MRRSKPSLSVNYYILCLKSICADKSAYSDKLFKQLLSDLVDVLHSLDLNDWAYAILRESILACGVSVPILKNLILVTDSLDNHSSFDSLGITSKVFADVLLQDCSAIENMSLNFAFAFHHHIEDNNRLALDYYYKAMAILNERINEISDDEIADARRLVNENSWNFGCVKLQMGDYDGWRLFEYGLQAPAIGKQKWQRALTKPFSVSEIALWRGENLANKRILLLEEQAVGDAMMFLTLVPDLLENAQFIGLYVSKRFIYIRLLKNILTVVSLLFTQRTCYFF